MQEKALNIARNEEGIDEQHYIVAIGASAGGLEAIHEFFDHTPENDAISYVLIQHLSSDYKSLLVDLVSRHTHMKVYEAADNLTIHKNCIYVIPNNKLITISENKLILTEKLPHKIPNNAIDVFLYSLAKEKQKQAIAIVLSGTGTDGTKGIQEIKNAGGLVIVQDPSSARFDGMPNSAINSGNVDYILAPSDIPDQILQYLREPEQPTDFTVEPDMLQEIFQLLQQQADFDFHYYKTPTIIRRIANRMAHGEFDSVRNYTEHLRESPEECKQLSRDFLISVTRFFRDGEAFVKLRNEIIPSILETKEKNETIKAWVCACSTGEEAYSLAIVINEAIEEQQSDVAVKIFATDIERSNIEIASKGIYPYSIEKDVDAQLLEKYFTRQSDGYHIVPKLRKQIVFAQHNVIKDPPFIKNDLVSCRNMLIYMTPMLQQRVYSLLLFSVVPKGYIFLGSSESPNHIKNHIREISSKCRIYQKISEARFHPFMPDIAAQKNQGRGVGTGSIQSSDFKRQRNLWEDFGEAIVEEFGFVGFYIDRNYEIRETVGNFDTILSLPKKILKLNLLRMLPGSISSILLRTLKDAWKSQSRKVIRNVSYTHNGKDIRLQVLIKPEDELKSIPYTLVAFQSVWTEEMPRPEPAKQHSHEPGREDYLLVLEEELNETKLNLQHAIEDLETINEELQSSNEELLSSNEELQSSNEELQSLNEELHTLNTEHQLKIKELIELNEDLNNYFRSSDIGQVFLDKNFAIRKFNPASSRMINFIPTDIGRPISHISTNINADLIDDIKYVARTNETIEKEVQLESGKNLLLRMMPYLNQDHEGSGIIITFVDITTITNLNNIIRGVFNSSLSAILALQTVRNNREKVEDFVIQASNHASAALFSNSESKSETLLTKLLPENLKQILFKQFIDVIDSDKPLHTDIYDEHGKRWFEIIAVKMMGGLVATFTDITPKKVAEERLKKNYVELVNAKESLKRLNAELEQKVKERTQLLAISEERFRLVTQATNDVIWDWNLITNELWLSETDQAKFGYNNAPLFTWQSMLDKIHPDDRGEVEESIYRVINSGANLWTMEYLFCKADGTYANILNRGYIMQDEFKTPYRMLGSMLDLTELRRVEQEVASNIAQRKFLTESMPLIVLTASADGRVNYINNQFEYYTGQPNNDALEHGWKKVIYPLDSERFSKRWNEAVQSKKDFQLELRIQHHDKYHWNLLSAKVRKDEQDNVIDWVITMIDIHTQKRINETLEKKVEERTQELLKINEALEISNNDLQQFASAASHDLQEPLRKIQTFANVIEAKYASHLGDGNNYLQKIIHSSIRMRSLITNVLNFSKLSADNGIFERTNINALILEIIDDFEILIREKNATVEVDRIPVIDAIPGQIRQVFQNIISNSLKFSKENVPLSIRITSGYIAGKSFQSPAVPDGQYCKITMEDNGIGFDEKFSENIFQLFQRLNPRDSFEGTGIGLAITKKIIEKHQGLIAAHGKEGVGATFEIILPVRQL
jgi:two-component system CheB/CheR fusion protein